MRTNKKVQVIIFKNLKDPLFLLLKTNQGEKSFWQGVTGGVEDTDSSIEEAAIREVSEELSIKITDLKGPIHSYKFKTSHPDYIGQEMEEFCFYSEVPENTEIILSDEHQEFKWLSFKEAHDLIAHDNPKLVLEKIQLQLPLL
jgi:dihydroneopterin triphosphate diphosphatase